MFRSIYKKFAQSNLFQKLLLFVGIAIGVIGFWLINKIYINEPVVGWSFITAVFLWLLLIFVVILTDSSESIKEELSAIIKEHINETRLLKEEVVLVRKIANEFVRKKKISIQIKIS